MFSREITGGVLVLRPAHAKLRDPDADALIDLVFDGGPMGRKIVIDLEPVDYVSTSVLSALTRVATEHRVRLVSVSGALERLFRVLGVAQYFHRCASVADALDDLGVESDGAPE